MIGSPLALPDTPWKPFEEAKGNYQRLRGEWEKTSRTLDQLAREREQAVAEDRALLAAALRDGKTEPEDQAVQDVDGRITAASRRLEALELAVLEAERTLLDVVERHRERWARDQAARVQKSRQAVAAALEEYANVRSRLMDDEALTRFLTMHPHPKSYLPLDAPLLGIRKPSGEPTGWAELLGALRADAAGPPPKLEEAPRVAA